MIFPILLILIGTIASCAVALGTIEWWAQFPHGLDVVLWSRRLQWPAAVVVGLAVVILIALVLSRRNKAWWLIGLLPILGLLALSIVPSNETMLLVENPLSVGANQAKFLSDNDWLVGVRFEGRSYAYPFQSLRQSPVVLQADRENRMLLIWSPWANRATAQVLAREMKLRDLEYVGAPANATLLYDRRLGQFINGLTGLTPAGQKPVGFRSSVETIKTTWGRWKSLYPDTTVMMPIHRPLPTAALDPMYPMPQSPTPRPAGRIAMIATTQPIAVPSESVGDLPVNLPTPAGGLLLVRDKSTRQIRAFARQIEDDLSVRFVPNADPKRTGIAWIDVDTNTGWSNAGIAIDGPPEHRGQKLTSHPVDDGLDFAVMKFWYPSLEFVQIKNEMLGHALTPEVPKPPKRAVRKR